MELKALIWLNLIALVACLSLAVHAQTFSVIHSFQGGPLDGDGPQSGVTIKGNNLYGTTVAGGASCGQGHTCGTVYQLTRVGSDWVETLIFRFPTPGNSYNPSARVLFGPDGHLYGTASVTLGGGGSVYRLTPRLSICRTAACFWTAIDLHTFDGGRGDGIEPLYGDLIWDKQDNIYGTTVTGGQGSGTVFQMTGSGDNWTETPIYSFGSGDGCNPFSGVVIDSSGNLFGTTNNCGANFDGTVYELTYDPQAGWKETTLWNFTGGSDGLHPYAGVILDSFGNLYGATIEGSQGSAVFELSPSGKTWTFKVLYHFPVGWGGVYGNLTLDAAGNLYGTTYSGGQNQQGTVFKLTNTGNGWVYTSLHDFSGGAGGGNPWGNVSIDIDGTLYGTTLHGGSGCAPYGCGTVWMIKP